MHYAASGIKVPMTTFNLQVSHSKRSPTVTDNKTVLTTYCDKSYINVVSVSWNSSLYVLIPHLTWEGRWTVLAAGPSVRLPSAFWRHVRRRAVCFSDLRRWTVTTPMTGCQEQTVRALRVSPRWAGSIVRDCIKQLTPVLDLQLKNCSLLELSF